mmetsp:Transcript_25862/g.57058  ORF Transcript_25862/g.57058 Transcript_25862/m.57058 type:complete len:131 (-) Transcript_25862:36-428(-)|eukprot:CAMPEP_0204389556 /NCGR_PEP_ID=MMETSP0469-20131031/60179_1 /ASSEMBLY_ACC=CAM_ASM_000384 /TAXON_ID=2969 /ORGANISM="Oxyrrhis marina" /LENGTH=130 /DNA_ID=CAMNT_0051383259 /DNA_START=154 /DNA_END=546 /DNA_ORIENTATION=-
MALSGWVMLVVHAIFTVQLVLRLMSIAPKEQAPVVTTPAGRIYLEKMEDELSHGAAAVMRRSKVRVLMREEPEANLAPYEEPNVVTMLEAALKAARASASPTAAAQAAEVEAILLKYTSASPDGLVAPVK